MMGALVLATDTVDDGGGLQRGRQSLADSVEALRHDEDLLARVDAILSAMRSERSENHWAAKVAATFRGNQ